MQKSIRVVICALAWEAGVVGASAHVKISPRDAPAGHQTAISFDVMHGCSGSATTSITLRIPEVITMAKPQGKPGCSIDVTPRNSADADARHAAMKHEGMKHESMPPAEITWRGGPLPDALYDSFVVILKLPETPGSTLVFPVIQRCETGERLWTEPGEGHGAHDPPDRRRPSTHAGHAVTFKLLGGSMSSTIAADL